MSSTAAARRSPATARAGNALAQIQREFAYTDEDFARIRQLIRARAGIALGPGKRNLAYSRVSRLVRSARHRTFRAYLDALEASPDAAASQAFVNALTTNLTAFFREAHHFPVLARHLGGWPRREPMVVWCAAASTGEEAYSIAMTACEAFDSLTPPVRIIASDIDTGVLEIASRGVYPLDRVEAVEPRRLRRFFQRGRGHQSGLARVRNELRDLIEFRRVNLLDPGWPLPDGLAAIFCRNVLIYFDRATQSGVVERMAPLLAPNGLLFAGHSENLAWARQYRARGHTVYALDPERC
jgi:chemotaxis protein methyltransferase CheR